MVIGSTITFGLTGCTAVVQHESRALTALAIVCPKSTPIVSVRAGYAFQT